jgi:pyruvate/2-oxoglutarate dehydrogenase complex dihydrolipoamide acyltransferase (E2) component
MNNVQQIMQQAQAGETDSGSAVGSWISSWFGGNDPGKPVAQAAPQATPAPAAGGRATRSASALLDMALQDAGTDAAAPSRQLPTGGRVAFEEAMPMATPAAVESPAPSPSPSPTPMPQQQFVGEVFTPDQFRQMTGKDLAPGEYFDAKGRPFLVK